MENKFFTWLVASRPLQAFWLTLVNFRFPTLVFAASTLKPQSQLWWNSSTISWKGEWCLCSKLKQALRVKAPKVNSECNSTKLLETQVTPVCLCPQTDPSYDPCKVVKVSDLRKKRNQDDPWENKLSKWPRRWILWVLSCLSVLVDYQFTWLCSSHHAIVK